MLMEKLREEASENSNNILFSDMGQDAVAVPGDSLENSDGAFWVRRHLLGKGGFGSVFYAKLKPRSPLGLMRTWHIPCEMAVKSAKMSDYRSLYHEKQILCDLRSSPYVVKCIYDEITELINGEKIYNLFLEFCSGGSLYDQITLSGGSGLAECDVKNYTRDILHGLVDIHSRGYVHCDIKPSNILLVPGSDERRGGFMLKIADFGLAKVMGLVEEKRSELIGTPYYMAPELVRDGKLEYCADIWALGCVVLEMLTGKSAWEYRDKEYIHFLLRHTDRVPIVPNYLPFLAQDFLLCCFDRRTHRRPSAAKILYHPFVSMDKW